MSRISQRQHKVVGGFPVKYGEAPWTVSIKKREGRYNNPPYLLALVTYSILIKGVLHVLRRRPGLREVCRHRGALRPLPGRQGDIRRRRRPRQRRRGRGRDPGGGAARRRSPRLQRDPLRQRRRRGGAGAARPLRRLQATGGARITGQSAHRTGCDAQRDRMGHA